MRVKAGFEKFASPSGGAAPGGPPPPVDIPGKLLTKRVRTPASGQQHHSIQGFNSTGASRLPRADRRAAAGKQSLADFTLSAVPATGATVLSAVKDDLEVQPVPAFPGKEPFQSLFSIHDVFAAGQAPTLGETVNVGVYWKRRNTKTL